MNKLHTIRREIAQISHIPNNGKNKPEFKHSIMGFNKEYN